MCCVKEFSKLDKCQIWTHDEINLKIRNMVGELNKTFECVALNATLFGSVLPFT